MTDRQGLSITEINGLREDRDRLADLCRTLQEEVQRLTRELALANAVIAERGGEVGDV